MQYSFSFDPIAAIEYEEAYLWYQEKSARAAQNFILSVEKGVKAICSNPLRYRNTYRNLREISIKKYPYCLIYLVDEMNKNIIITSVYHHNRNPDKKYIK